MVKQRPRVTWRSPAQRPDQHGNVATRPTLSWAQIFSCLLLSLSGACGNPDSCPLTRRVDVRDNYFGQEVDDPFRWMEQVQFAKELNRWLVAQGHHAESWLGQDPAIRTRIRSRVEELLGETSWGVPFRRGDQWFFARHAPSRDQEYPVLCRSSKPFGLGHVALDPSELSSERNAYIAGLSVSPRGNFAAYTLQSSTSRPGSWNITSLDANSPMERIHNARIGDGWWMPDESGLFYETATTSREGHEMRLLCFHELGASQDQDAVVHQTDGSDSRYTLHVLPDGSFAFLIIRNPEHKCAVVILDLRNPISRRRLTVDGDYKFSYSYVGSSGRSALLLTDRGGQRGRIVRVDIGQPGTQHWHEVVGEQSFRMQWALACGPEIIVARAHGQLRRLHRFSAQGTDLGLMALPPGLSVDGTASLSEEDASVYFALSSPVQRPSIWRFDTYSGKLTVGRSSGTAEVGTVSTSSIAYTTKDDLQLPAITFELKGHHSTPRNVLLEGYGAYGQETIQRFDPVNRIWIEWGGICVFPIVRGDGGRGTNLHAAGLRERKTNSIEDFLSCAEFVNHHGPTAGGNIIARGFSAGGLLVSAAMNRRPSLFCAVVTESGLYDMLRYHLSHAGRVQESEFGSIDKEPEFQTLRSYSPLHNVAARDATGPPVLVSAGLQDRVTPAWHACKYVATLQREWPRTPVLLRTVDSGHRSRPWSQRVSLATDVLTFAYRSMQAHGSGAIGW